MALRSAYLGRVFDESTSGQINRSAHVAKPHIISRQEWGAGPSSATLMRSHVPTRLTLHHEASAKPLVPGEDPKVLLQNLQQWGWRDRRWPDIPYHFMLDLDGNIYEARDPGKVGDTATTYNPSGHLLVTLMGNYELQAPNEKQLKALCDLLAWLCDYYNIDPATIHGHMDYVPTLCPGKYLYPYVASGFIEGEVRKRLRAAYLRK